MNKRLVCSVADLGVRARGRELARGRRLLTPSTRAKCRSARKRRRCRRAGTYQAPRTSWGDPAIAGAYNNSDETGIPFERPAEFADRTLESFTPEELASIHGAAPAPNHRAQSDAQRVPRRHEPDALVRELLRRQQPPVARLRPAGRQGAGADGRSSQRAQPLREPREPAADLPTPTPIAASTIAASRAACRAR